MISIHALRGEGDDDDPANTFTTQDFNPRPPWGGRQKLKKPLTEIILFQSTPSVGRATFCPRTMCGQSRYFNPRPPWGGRPVLLVLPCRELTFQSTPSVGRATASFSRQQRKPGFQSTPSVGRATTTITNQTYPQRFQSTPSVGRATRRCFDLLRAGAISIHALRGEGDSSEYILRRQSKYFNPRPPWGGRQQLRERYERH